MGANPAVVPPVTDGPDPIYRVVEDVDGKLQDEVITAADWTPGRFLDYNKRHRIYSRLQEARNYAARMEKQGRRPVILKFVYEGVVQ